MESHLRAEQILLRFSGCLRDGRVEECVIYGGLWKFLLRLRVHCWEGIQLLLAFLCLKSYR